MAAQDRIAQARSFLFVPGNRPERFAKAIASGADAVILDLEDAVPPAEKSASRAAVANALRESSGTAGTPLVIRVNGLQVEDGKDDLAWLPSLETLPAAIMVPKAETRAALESWHACARGAMLLPLVESAVGHANLAEIAGAAGVARLVFGHIDFMADTGIECSDEETELLPLRFAIAMQTRLSGLAPAVDGVTVTIGDDAKLRRDTERAVRLGFGAKLCIHPRQVAVVHEVMAPSAAEVEWARRVIDGDANSGGSAFQLDGRMVDAPVVLQAKRTLARAQRPV